MTTSRIFGRTYSLRNCFSIQWLQATSLTREIPSGKTYLSKRLIVVCNWFKSSDNETDRRLSGDDERDWCGLEVSECQRYRSISDEFFTRLDDGEHRNPSEACLQRRTKDDQTVAMEYSSEEHRECVECESKFLGNDDITDLIFINYLVECVSVKEMKSNLFNISSDTRATNRMLSYWPVDVSDRRSKISRRDHLINQSFICLSMMQWHG